MSHSRRAQPVRWSAAEIMELRKLHGTMTLAEIGAVMGRTKGSVRRAVAVVGLNCTKLRSGPGRGGYSPPWTDEDRQFVRDNYATTPAPEIAEKLGRSLTGLHVQASLMGIGSYHRKANSSLVLGYFKVIDTPVKAYLLGLLMADGYVTGTQRLQLGLALRDYDRKLVELLRDELAPEARLHTYLTREGNTMVVFKVGVSRTDGRPSAARDRAAQDPYRRMAADGATGA